LISFNQGTGLYVQFQWCSQRHAGRCRAQNGPPQPGKSCANPATPCLLAAFLNADPRLNQVIRTLRVWWSREKAWFPGAIAVECLRIQQPTAPMTFRRVATHQRFGYFHNGGTAQAGARTRNVVVRREGLEFPDGYDWLSDHVRNAQLSPTAARANGSRPIFVSPGRWRSIMPAAPTLVPIRRKIGARAFRPPGQSAHC